MADNSTSRQPVPRGGLLHTLRTGPWPVLIAALWWGSLCTIGFLAVPMLFANLPSAVLAGGMAAKLFAAQTWVSVACTLLLLAVFREALQSRGPGGQAVLGVVLLGLLAALVVQFGVSPQIVARNNLKLWHNVGTALYVLQWACATVVLWGLAAPGRAARR